MKNFRILLILSALVLLFSSAISAQKSKMGKMRRAGPPLAVNKEEKTQKIVEYAVSETVKKFSSKGFKEENVAVTLVDFSRNQGRSFPVKAGSFRGDVKIYPASVVKMFYMYAVFEWLRLKKLKDGEELRRALQDMIVDSSNDATHYIVDVLTGATGGSELSPSELKAWSYKRNAVNRYLGFIFSDINVNQKTYCEDIYGRERQFWDGGKNRNMLTTEATALLLTKIYYDRYLLESSKEMLALMKRNPAKEVSDPDSQDVGFTGLALKDEKDVKLWSKAGWTSNSRHDVALVETKDGLKFIICIFTEKFANEREIIPNIVKIAMEEMRKNKDKQ